MSAECILFSDMFHLESCFTGKVSIDVASFKMKIKFNSSDCCPVKGLLGLHFWADPMTSPVLNTFSNENQIQGLLGLPFWAAPMTSPLQFTPFKRPAGHPGKNC